VFDTFRTNLNSPTSIRDVMKNYEKPNASWELGRQLMTQNRKTE